jgi:hypothetical protein
MNANELADIVDHWAYKESAEYLTDAAAMLRQQQAEIANLKAGLLSHHDIYPVKELTDEEWNKAFDFYCETDEGVLKFDLELRDEWKKEQLIRWKEALRKAQNG